MRRTRSQRPASAGSWVISMQGGAVGARQLEQQVDDLPAGLAVEIAGRLVGQQQRGPADEGAGEGDPLLLAAGQLAG